MLQMKVDDAALIAPRVCDETNICSIQVKTRQVVREPKVCRFLQHDKVLVQA